MGVPNGATEADRGSRTAQNIGVGCVMAVSGCFGGGMIAVFLAKIVGSAQRCEPATGVPACNWPVYAVIGMGMGLVLLPTMVLWRLNRK